MGYALRLLALTFVRTGELIGAEWSEIDMDGATWNIPGGRMKMKTEHVVPLSHQALAQHVRTSNVYTGTLYQTSGPRFDAYDRSKATLQPVGSATFTFPDGNNASFEYTTSGAGGPSAGGLARI